MMRIFATGFSEGFDGPGRRLVVYLKGCNLKCRWCANPESIHFEKEILFYANRDIAFPEVCRFGAISESGSLNRAWCKKCTEHSCVHLWKHKAFELAGEDVSPGWVLDQALRAKPFFGSNGGVTFGGGEATLQMDELLETLKLLKTNEIHTAIETNASSEWFSELLDCVDWLICDLKCADAVRHKTWTGMDNETILHNIRLAAERRKQLVVRIPLVPGVNDDESEKKRITEFLIKIGHAGFTVEILRLHHIGKCKYDALGLKYPMDGVPEPTIEDARYYADELNERGLCARLG
jgi:pyruvate formate lyase activating enzyme